MRKNKDVIVFDAIKNKNKIHLSIVATDDKGNEYIMWIQLIPVGQGFHDNPGILLKQRNDGF